jgi:hypothetical protein
MVELESLEFSESFGLIDTMYMAPSQVSDTALSLLYPEVEFAVEGMAWPGRWSKWLPPGFLRRAGLLGEGCDMHSAIFFCVGNTCYVNGTGNERSWVFHENLGMVYKRDQSPYGSGVQVIEDILTCYQTSWGNGGTCLVLLSLATNVAEEVEENAPFYSAEPWKWNLSPEPCPERSNP